MYVYVSVYVYIDIYRKEILVKIYFLILFMILCDFLFKLFGCFFWFLIFLSGIVF